METIESEWCVSDSCQKEYILKINSVVRKEKSRISGSDF